MPVPPSLKTVRASGASPLTILIADDSAAFRTSLRLLLQAVDPTVHVVEASDGIEALSSIDEGGVHTVICDLEMPRMDGRKLIHLVARRADKPQVIVMTGAPPSQGAAWMHDNVIGVLEKPFEHEELLELLYGPPVTRQTAS